MIWICSSADNAVRRHEALYVGILDVISASGMSNRWSMVWSGLKGQMQSALNENEVQHSQRGSSRTSSMQLCAE